MQRTGLARKLRLQSLHILICVAHLNENGATFHETIRKILTDPKMFINEFNTVKAQTEMLFYTD